MASAASEADCPVFGVIGASAGTTTARVTMAHNTRTLSALLAITVPNAGPTVTVSGGLLAVGEELPLIVRYELAFGATEGVQLLDLLLEVSATNPTVAAVLPPGGGSGWRFVGKSAGTTAISGLYGAPGRRVSVGSDGVLTVVRQSTHASRP